MSMPMPVVIGPVNAVSAPAAVTLTTTDQRLAAANPRRAVSILSNSGSSTAYIRFGTTSASATAGGYHLALAPNTTWRLPDGWTWEIHVIGPSLAPSGVVTLTELVAN